MREWRGSPGQPLLSQEAAVTGAGPAGGAAAVLLRYLREQNRPYSAQDAFGNLQREHGLGKAVSRAGPGWGGAGPGPADAASRRPW